MKNITLSIIIPTYKRNDYLSRALDSILSQKGRYEVIVVDDNDSDSEYRQKNIELMKKYKDVIYLKHKKNKNGAAARNTGIAEAQGKYITFLDDDDEFTPTRIEKITEYIDKYNPDFICSGYIYKYNSKIISQKIPDVDKNRKKCELELLKAKSFFGTGSNIICKKDIIQKIGGFDESFLRNQDIEFIIRYLKESKKIYVIPEYLVIKNIENIINVPNIEKALDNKIKFLNKFKSLIDLYDEETKKSIYTTNYYELMYNAIKKQDKYEIKQAKKILKEKNIYSCGKVFMMKLKRKIKTLSFKKNK